MWCKLRFQVSKRHKQRVGVLRQRTADRMGKVIGRFLSGNTEWRRAGFTRKK